MGDKYFKYKMRLWMIVTKWMIRNGGGKIWMKNFIDGVR